MLGERSIVCNAEGVIFRKKRLCTRCFWNKACVSRYNIYFDVITVSFVSRYMMRQDESSQKFKYNISIYINDELIHIYIYIFSNILVPHIHLPSIIIIQLDCLFVTNEVNYVPY